MATSAPARRSRAENGQPSSAARPRRRAPRPPPLGLHTDVDVRADDLVALALDLVHHDRAVGLDRDGWRARRRPARSQRHVEAARVGGREQLLGARLALRLADSRRQRVGQAGRRRSSPRSSRRRGRRSPPSTTCAVRSIRGISPPPVPTAPACRRGSTPRRVSRPGGRRRGACSSPGPVFSRQWTSLRGRCTHEPGRSGADSPPMWSTPSPWST